MRISGIDRTVSHLVTPHQSIIMTTRIIVALVALPAGTDPGLAGRYLVHATIPCHRDHGWIGVLQPDESRRLPAKPLAGFGMAGSLVLNGWQPRYLPLSLLLVVGLIATLVDALRQKESPASTWMSTSMGALYLGVMIGQALAMRQLPDGLWWLLFGLVITWTNDTVAYFTGVTIGKHKLWPRLSPKKTWEGTIGGWIGAGISGGIVIWLIPTGSSILFGVVLGTALWGTCATG